VFPIDPRPGSDGPATFFLDADFQLTQLSAAIDNAWEATAIPTDFLGNSQVKINGAGLGLTGFGPRDVGAFEFNGVGGSAVGGAFRVVTTSLVPVGGAMLAGGSTINLTSAPTSVQVTFSRNINPSDISATDLVLSGSAVQGVHATSLTWIDAHTVQFNLSGPLASSGTVNLSIAGGSITSTTGTPNVGYSDHVVLNVKAITPPPQHPAPPVNPVSPAPGTPPPAAAPHGPLHAKKKVHHVVNHHPAKKAHHVVTHKPKQKAKHAKKA
jgi:hypothetical protein